MMCPFSKLNVLLCSMLNSLILMLIRLLIGRSLIAAYLLVLNGYKNVFHLEGGLYTWFKEGLPAVSLEEE